MWWPVTILSLGVWRTKFWCPLLLVPVYEVLCRQSASGWNISGLFSAKGIKFWGVLAKLQALVTCLKDSFEELFSQPALDCQRTSLKCEQGVLSSMLFLGVPMMTWYLNYFVKTACSPAHKPFPYFTVGCRLLKAFWYMYSILQLPRCHSFFCLSVSLVYIWKVRWNVGWTDIGVGQ